MSHPIDRSMAIHEYKRMKTKRSGWRSVNTQSHSHEVMDGPSIESTTAAAEKIQQTLEAVKSPNLEYSHFISLPLAIHPALVEKLTNFQKSILELIGKVNTEERDFKGSSSEESSDEDPCEELDKGAEIGGNINVADGSGHAKLNMVQIPAKNVFSNTPRSFSQVKGTHLHPPDLGIAKSIFIKPKTFHLTVLMLKLWNKERISAAAEALRKVSPQVTEALEGRPVVVSLKGLKCMKGWPSKAHVLYAHVEEVGSSGRLLRACQVIIDAFLEAGLVAEKDASHALKLHATVMNTRHRKPKKLCKRNIPFDARPILERYGSEDWGEYVIHEAHLSQRSSYDESGYYHCCASIPFPEIAQEVDIR